MANMRTDKVRAFLSSLPPGQIKLTLARSDKVLGSQDSRDRSVMHVLISPALHILADVMNIRFISTVVHLTFYIHSCASDFLPIQYLLVCICALNL